LKRGGAAPHIAFEPNDGLDIVEDGPYLRAWARDAARARVPIFLRWGERDERAVDVEVLLFRFEEAERRSREVHREIPPRLAHHEGRSAQRRHGVDALRHASALDGSYYPGDEWVDWVGVNIYAVYVNNGDPFQSAAQKDIVAWLRWVYDRYATRKPIHVSEFAATIFCKGSAEDTVGFAIDRMRKFYGAIRTQFPRVKSVNWFCWDTIRAGRANNNYSFIDDGLTRSPSTAAIVAYPHFLSDVVADTSVLEDVRAHRHSTLGPNGIVLKGRTRGTNEILAAHARSICTRCRAAYLGHRASGKQHSRPLDTRFYRRAAERTTMSACAGCWT
jgi:hypothetical protein